MEYRPFGPEEQDDKTSNSSSKKERAGGSLFRHLSLLRRKERAEAGGIESEDDDTESSEKPKKWRKYFSRIFPSIVERPEGYSTEKSSFDPETFLSWGGSRKEVPEDADSNIEEINESHLNLGHHVEDDSPSVEQTLVSDESDQVSETVPVTSQPETDSGIESVTDDEVKGQINFAEASVRTPGEFDSPEEAQAEDSLLSTPEYANTLPLTQENTAENRSVSEKLPTAVEKETVIEKGVGSILPVALVGVEYLARKRADRKLEARINSKLETSGKESKISSVNQEELARIVHENHEQLDQLKRHRSHFEQVSESKKIESQLPSSKAETSRPVKLSPIENRREVQESKVSSEMSTESFQPQKILEQVAVAAEQDSPVERVFERSHEVKDDKTVPIGAASVGSVVQAQLSARNQANSTIPHSMVSGSNIDDLPIIAEQNATWQYKRAATAGFSAALMIIILGSIAYLMVK